MKFPKGARVRLSPAGRDIVGDRKDRVGTISGRPRRAGWASVLWDGLKTRYTYAEQFLEHAEEEPTR